MTVRAEDLRPGQRISLSSAEVLSTMIAGDMVLVSVLHLGEEEPTVYHYRTDDLLEVIS